MEKMQTDFILSEMEKTFGEVYAACLYGSQVCGYATKSSDHDVLVILEDYEPNVKYTYVQDEIEIAFLCVAKRVFEEDVKEAVYGGFIADRLINPIYPLINEEYLQRSEVKRKKQIVDWETTKLILKKREVAKYLDINILYYPFKKWSKIGAIYPPYLYSIENTLRKDLKEKNLKALLPGYSQAVKELDHLREVYPGWYMIKDGFAEATLERGPLPRLERIKMIEREIENIVSRYLTQTRAGDSDRDLIVKELISKVKREVRHLKEKGLSSSLEDPEKFLLYPK
jgi:predicted nucleotidyltransferase